VSRTRSPRPIPARLGRSGEPATGRRRPHLERWHGSRGASFPLRSMATEPSSSATVRNPRAVLGGLSLSPNFFVGSQARSKGSSCADQDQTSATPAPHCAARRSKLGFFAPSVGPIHTWMLPGGVAVAVGALCVAKIDADSGNWGQLVFLRARPDVFLRLLGWGPDGDDRG